MNRWLLQILFLLSLAVHNTSFGDAPYDEEGIKKTLTAFVEGWNKHDPKIMASYWDLEGNIIAPSGKLATSQREVEALFTQDLREKFFNTTFEQQVQFVKFLSPSLAFADTEILARGIQAQDPEDKSKLFHVLFILEKKGENWQIIAARVYELHGPITRVTTE